MTQSSLSSRGVLILELALTALLLFVVAGLATKIVFMVLGTAIGLAGALFWTVVYFIPSFMARGKSSFFPILMVNIFFGWSVIGWIVALIWAMGADGRSPKPSAAE